MELAHRERLAGAIKVAVVQRLSLDSEVCLVVRAATQQVDIPFTSKLCLQTRLTFVANSITYKQSFFARGKKDLFTEIDGNWTHGTGASHNAIARERHGKSV